MINDKLLEISPEVHQALNDDIAVVALESTIISHGMPYPKNVETARKVEQQVRDRGAIPATIAIIEGKLRAGLNEQEIDRLGQKGQAITKTSRRDLPFVVAQKQDGATTVAATMAIAAMAEIRVFATGGIGGVHRGVAATMDVSSDLQELAKTNVAVVCAGVKSILDIPHTLEYLETHGVPVIGYQTSLLPAFYARESDSKVDYRLDDAKQIAMTMLAKWQLGLDGGLVIANPVPEQYAMNRNDIDAVISQALVEMDEKGIAGKLTTPYLLDRIRQLTEGRSLETNIELVLNNARLAANIANEYVQAQHTSPA